MGKKEVFSKEDAFEQAVDTLLEIWEIESELEKVKGDMRKKHSLKGVSSYLHRRLNYRLQKWSLPQRAVVQKAIKCILQEQ